MLRRPTRLALVVVVALLLSLVMPGSASADSSATGGEELHAVAYDVPNSRVYVGTATSVEVYSTSWSHLGTVDLNGAWVSAITVGGGAVWVAEPSTGDIVKVDPTSLTVLDTYGGGSISAEQLAYAGGKVWFGGQNLGGVGALDPGTGSTTLYLADGTNPYPNDAGFATDPGHPDTLYVYDSVGSSVARWDVSTDPPTVVGTYDTSALGTPTAATVSPDGTRLFVGYTAPTSGVITVKTADMSSGMNYPWAGPYYLQVTSVAVASDGAHLAVGTGSEFDGIAIFAVGTKAPVRIYHPGWTCNGVPGDLSFSDASTLLLPLRGEPAVYLKLDGITSPGTDATIDLAPLHPVPTDPVTQTGTLTLGSGDSASGLTLHVWRMDPGSTSPIDLGTTSTSAQGAFSFQDTAPDQPVDYCYEVVFEGGANDSATVAGSIVTAERLGSALSLSVSPKTVAPTATETVSGSLTTADGLDQGGQTITIQRRHGYGTYVTAGTTITGADGSFTFQEPAPLNTGQYTYVAAFDGNVRDAATQSPQRIVTVARRDPHLTLTKSKALITYGDPVSLAVGLGKGVLDRSVKIYQRYGSKRTLIKTVTVPTSSTVTLKLAPTQNVTYIAEYAGDAADKPASASVDVHVRSIVTCRLLKDAGTSGNYHLYHQADPVYMYGKVKPDHTGKTVKLDIERGRNGGLWSNPATSAFTLKTGSQVLVYIKGGVIPSGTRLRVRYWLSDGDHWVGYSKWQYVKIIP